MANEAISVDVIEEARVSELTIAQEKVQQLVHEVETRGLIRAGITESRLNQEIYDLAEHIYGISTYWHKRIARAGAGSAASSKSC